MLVELAHAAAPQRADATSVLERRLGHLKDKAVGVLVVEQLSRHCAQGGPGSCLEWFSKARRTAGLHPLVAQALDRRFALGLRVAGKREEAVQAAEGLGYIRSFRTLTADGEEVELPADPVSGEVRGSDFLEFPAGEPVRIWTDLESRTECLVALRVAAADLAEICIGNDCVSVAAQRTFFPDQHALAAHLVPGVTRIELRFQPGAASQRLAGRLTRLDGGALPISSLGGRTVVSAPPRKVGAELEGVDRSLALLPEGNEKLLLSCFLEREAGRGEGGSELDTRVAAARFEAESEWLEAVGCLEGSPVLLGFLDRVREELGPTAQVTLAEAAYLLRTGRQMDGLDRLRGLCPDGWFDCLPPELEARAALSAREPLASCGLSYLVEELLRRAAERAGQMPAVVSALAEVLSEQERYREAAEVVGAYLEKWPGDYEMAATQLFLLEKLGGAAEEVRVAERLNWLFPTMPFLRHVLAASLSRAGERTRAAELYGSLEAWAPFHPYLLEQAAQFHFGNGERERAIALWKKVLRLHPQDRNLRGLLARLQSEANPAALRFSDADIAALAAGMQSNGPQGLVGVMDRTFIEAYANRAWRLERWVAVKATAPVGAGRLELGVAYDSYLEEAAVLRCAVIRTDGGQARTVQYADTGLSEEEFNLYYDMRQVTFPFPAMREGDIAVAAWLVESSPSPLGTPFSGVVWLQEDYPKHGVEVTVTVPPDTDLFHRAGPAPSAPGPQQEITAGSDGTTYKVRFGTIPALLPEPLGQGRFRTAAHFQYSTLATWEDFVRWYAPVVAPARQGDSAMKRLVADMVEQASGDRTALTEALCRYVADEVRYVGLDFGVHGLKPYPPAEVFRRGFGDCKDKSLLLVTLLAEAGIPAHVVATSTLSMGAEELDPGAPTPYDHAIAYLDELGVFFDPTARYVGLGQVPWQVEGGLGVVIDSARPRKVVFEESPAENNRSELSLSVTGGAPMAFSGTLRFAGQFVWRVLQVAENRGGWENELESYLADYLPAADIEDIQEEVIPGRTPELLVTLSGTWEPPGAALRLSPDLDALNRAAALAERKQPLQFGYAYVQEVRLRFGPGSVRLPVGMFQAVHEEDAAFSLQVEADSEGGSVLEMRIEQKNRTVPAERYPAFRRLVQQLRAALAAVEGVVDAP
jgi:transglutaminase-like putative cysteine protease/tetratricopeptide (TPR) repeat protein